MNVGRDSFQGVYLKQIPINTWKYINQRFEQRNSEDRREDFIKSIVLQISNCPEFISVIDQFYLKSIIENEELYLSLLGASLWQGSNEN